MTDEQAALDAARFAVLASCKHLSISARLVQVVYNDLWYTAYHNIKGMEPQFNVGIGVPGDCTPRKMSPAAVYPSQLEALRACADMILALPPKPVKQPVVD